MSTQVLGPIIHLRAAPRRRSKTRPRARRERRLPLPLYLERCAARNVFPTLPSIEYLCADAGDVHVGEIIILGGKRFELIDFTRGGEAIFHGPWLLTFPMSCVPHDKGTPILSADAIRQREQRCAERARAWSERAAHN